MYNGTDSRPSFLREFLGITKEDDGLNVFMRWLGMPCAGDAIRPSDKVVIEVSHFIPSIAHKTWQCSSCEISKQEEITD